MNDGLIVTVKVRLPFWGTLEDDIENGYSDPMDAFTGMVRRREPSYVGRRRIRDSESRVRMIQVELDSIRDSQYKKKLTMWAENSLELGLRIDRDDGEDDWIAIPVEAVKLAIEAIQLDFRIYDRISNEELNRHNGK